MINLASVHVDSLDLFGLRLVNIHEMLEFVFGNAYFVFNGRLYLQLVGLFMGCEPSPIGAIVHNMSTFERRSLYILMVIIYLLLSVYTYIDYRRYFDDQVAAAKSREHAQAASNDEFTPFLGT